MSFVGSFLLNNFLEDLYQTKKIGLENRIENLLNKEVNLGEYSGIRFLGISLRNFKINDNKNFNSDIEAKNIYIGIMPIRSFLNQRWIFNITPSKTNIEVSKDFFNRGKFNKNANISFKNKYNYDLNFNLKKSANFKLKDIGVETKLKGKLIYKSKSKQLFGNINSYAKGQGNLNVKLNTKLNKDFLI